MIYQTKKEHFANPVFPCTLKNENKQSSGTSRYSNLKCAAFTAVGDSTFYSDLQNKIAALEKEPGQSYSEYTAVIDVIDRMKESDYKSESGKTFNCLMVELYDILRYDINKVESNSKLNGGSDDLLDTIGGVPARSILLARLDSKITMYSGLCRGNQSGQLAAPRASAPSASSAAPTGSSAVPSASSAAPSASSAAPSASSAAPSASLAAPTGSVIVVKSEPQPSSSEMMDKIRPYMVDEIKNTLKGTFKDNLRDDIRADVRRMIEKKEASPSQQQASDFKRNRPCPDDCPDVCENDDYIRKDSIPCWNCNLPRN